MDKTIAEESNPKRQKTESTLFNVAIIGTAGRKDDAIKITKDLWLKMMAKAEEHIEKTLGFKWENVHMISGGAAVADHIAVALFHKHPESKLTLELPCVWRQGKYLDLGFKNWQKNPGGTSNYYHREFSKKVGINSLKDIDDAIKKGAKAIISNGFFERDSKIANAEYMLAFTFGKDEVKKGGTKHTWDLCKSGNKTHISLCD